MLPYSDVNQKYVYIANFKKNSVNSWLPFTFYPWANTPPPHSVFLYQEKIGCGWTGFLQAELIPSLMNLFVKLLVPFSAADWSQLHYVALISHIWHYKGDLTKQGLVFEKPQCSPWACPLTLPLSTSLTNSHFSRSLPLQCSLRPWEIYCSPLASQTHT